MDKRFVPQCMGRPPIVVALQGPFVAHGWASH
jgi:hypothetical protein